MMKYVYRGTLVKEFVHSLGLCCTHATIAGELVGKSRGKSTRVEPAARSCLHEEAHPSDPTRQPNEGPYPHSRNGAAYDPRMV